MTYTRPGIYVTEGPFTTNVASSPAAVASAFVGTAERGPTSPALISSWNSYKSQFGDLNANYEMGYALYHFFANGGRTAYVTRVVSGASTTAAATANFAGTVSSSSATVFKLRAPSVGTWGNNLKATVTAGNNTSTLPSFNLSVEYNDVVVETWSELSLDKNNSRYIEAILNNYSSYVYAYDVLYNSAASAAHAAGTPYTVTATSTATSLSGGHNGSAITTTANGDWNTALVKLSNVEAQLTINLVGQSDQTIINNAIAYVSYVDDATTPNARKNSFLVIDPSTSIANANDIKTLISGYTVSSFAAVYAGMLKMTNPAVRGAAALRDTFPGGAILGLYQRVDAERGVGRAPAGYSYTLQNAFGVVTSYSEADAGLLYGAHINVLKNVPGAGVIVNGARTLNKTDLTKYIPNRRTLNYVKAQIESVTQPAIFEPNTPRLWASISGSISAILADLWSAGALAGRSTAEAYYITCDATNNPQASIDAGEIHVEVGVALQTPAEFIVINVGQFTGGNTVTETL
jgi:phage tail sheath protein FI